MKRPLAKWPRQKKEVFRTARRLAVNGEPTQALKRVDAYLGREAEDVDLLTLKGNIFEMTGKFAQAAKVYTHVLKIDPDDPLALIDLGDYFKDRRVPDYQQALQHYDRALRSIEAGRFRYDEEDEFTDACIGKADTLFALHRPRSALRCITKGLQKYPAACTLRDALQRAQELRRGD